MKNYSEAQELLNGRASRKIGNNTYIRQDGEKIALRLHATDILTFTPDNSIIYNSGGWRTVTTKARMNEYGPAQITQKAGIWYIDGKVYADGCVYKNGRITGAAPAVDNKKQAKQLNALKKYVDDYMAAFMARKIPAPSGRDCWACYMTTKDGKALLGGPDHIKAHIKEKYYVPSLILRASEAFGVSIMAKNIFAYTWNPAHMADDIPEFIASIARDQLKKALYRYCKRELGMAA